MAKKENHEEPKIFGKTDETSHAKKDGVEGNAEQTDMKNKETQSGADEQAKEAKQEASKETDTLAKQVKALEEENSFLKDQLLRKQAEFENFRKRLLKEKDESMKYANQMLLLDLTAVIDDFERAFRSAESSKDFNQFHDGVVLIEKQLVSNLEKQWGVKRFEPKNEPFDPERHLAIAVEESQDQNFAVVTDVYQKGYLFHDRVLRPAKVKVVKPVLKNDGTAPESQKTDKT
jgi:molecular chaperone GrpE